MPRVTVGLPNFGGYFDRGNWHGLVDLAVQVEDVGLDAVSMGDHVVMGGDLSSYPYGRFPGEPDLPWLEPLTTLSAVAGATSRIGLTTSILISPLRPPALLAKIAATLDVLSGGRLVLGVGTGWQAAEYSAVGVDWSRRGQLLDDQLAACRALWAGGPTDFESETLSFCDVYCYPKPLQLGGVPFWIGGELTERNLNRIVRWGNGWIPSPIHDHTAVAEGVAALHAALREVGRDPASIRVRISPPTLRDEHGALDLEASLRAALPLVEAGGSDVIVLLQLWCPDVAEAPAFLRRLAQVRAVLGQDDC
jgi:probable F420-dependent oxidoreductase